MTTKITGIATVVALSMMVTLPGRAQPNRPGSPKPDPAEFAALERPVAFEISPSTGTLKETAQRGQESEAGGQVQMTFSGNTTSLGYSTSEEAKLNVIIRTPGGASLHSWSLGFSVRCGDNNQPLTPITHDVPRDLIPSAIDQNPCAHWRNPMDMIRQG
jgi:hypothetical protein